MKYKDLLKWSVVPFENHPASAFARNQNLIGPRKDKTDSLTFHATKLFRCPRLRVSPYLRTSLQCCVYGI